MFHSTGRPKTAVRLLCNVAWASSVGGLTLLAEERRRRVAFAQKIIENGRRLQGYKAYTGVAALAEFDLGQEWDTPLPNVDIDDSTNIAADTTLTNKEWRTRKRFHKLIPIFSLRNALVPPGLPNAPNRRASIASIQLDAKPRQVELPEKSVQISVTQCQAEHEASTQNVERASPGAAPIVDTSCGPKSKHIPRTTYSKRKLQDQAHSLYLEATVARFVSECLASVNSEIRAAGFRELAAFFAQHRMYRSPEMRDAVKVILAAPEANVEGSIAEQARMRAQSSIQWSERLHIRDQTIDAPDDHELIRKVTLTRPFPKAQTLPYKEQMLGLRIQTSLDAGQIDDAFFAFLTLCQNSTQPLGRTTRILVRKLSAAYKSLGLYSVVYEIHQKILYVLKEWRILYADVLWLMNQRPPDENLQFALQLFRAFLCFDRMSPTSLTQLSLRLINWFAHTGHMDHGLKLFLAVLESGLVESANDGYIEVACKFYEHFVRARNMDKAALLVSKMSTHNLVDSSTVQWTRETLNTLLHDGRIGDAAKLYVCSGRQWSGDSAPSDVFDQLGAAYPDFKEAVHTEVCSIVQDLDIQGKHLEIVEVSNLISDLSILDTRTEVLIYHAYAMAGPLTKSDYVVDGLAKSGIPLWSDLIHDSHSALVNRCWRQTRNLALTQSIFARVHGLGFHQSKSVKTFNAMILACVEAGLPELAQSYFERMSNEARIPPNLYTWANLMLAKAVSKDWDALRILFAKAQAKGALPANGEADGQFFDKVFAEFCRHHDATQIVDFGIHVTDSSRIRITQTVSDCVIDAAVKAESIELLTKWVGHMHIRGYDLSVGTESVSRILHRILQSKRLSFITTLIDAHHVHRTGTGLDVGQLWEHLKSVSSDAKTHKNGVKSKATAGSRRSTERRMLNALSNDEPTEALRLYQQSLVHGLPKQQLDLELAVRASLAANPDNPSLAHDLISGAKAAGLNVDRAATPLLLHKVKDMNLTYREAHDIAFAYYSTVDEPRIPLHHHVTLAVAGNLNDRGNTDGALRLLKAANDSEWGQRKPFDLAMLTMTLRLLIRQRHIEGINWVIDVVLRRNLRIDPVFLHTLHQGFRLSARVFLKNVDVDVDGTFNNHQRLNDRDSQYRAILQAHLDVCRERRQQQRLKTMQFARDTVQLLKEKKQVTTKATLDRAGGGLPLKYPSKAAEVLED